MRSLTQRLRLQCLEARDVPAQWYTLDPVGPAQGPPGTGDLTVTAGGPAADGGVDGAGLVWADGPADGVMLAPAGSVAVSVQTYELRPGTDSDGPAAYVPFVFVPTADGYELRLEDQAATPRGSDWDNNDTTWGVSVGSGTAYFSTVAEQRKIPPPDPKNTPKELPKPPARPPVVPAPRAGKDADGNPYLPAEPKVVPYKDHPPATPYQGGHLYQQSPFNSWINSGRAGSIPMYGNTTDPKNQHYTFHYYIDQFWDQYRKGGPKEGDRPTLAEYEAATREALEKMGYTKEEARRIQEDARKMMDAYRRDLDDTPKYPPLKNTDLVPYVPPPTVPPEPKK